MPDRFNSEPYRRPRLVEPFYAIGLPCEACGRPAREREYNAEHELWIGKGCVCVAEETAPVCPALLEPIMKARSVRKIVAACKAHRETCPVCKPTIRKEPLSETPQALATRKKTA